MKKNLILLSFVALVVATSLNVVMASDGEMEGPSTSPTRRVSNVDDDPTLQPSNDLLPREILFSIFSLLPDLTIVSKVCEFWCTTSKLPALYLAKNWESLTQQCTINSTQELCLLSLRTKHKDGPTKLFFHFMKYFSLPQNQRILLMGDDMSTNDYRALLSQDYASDAIPTIKPYLKALRVAAFFRHSQAITYWGILKGLFAADHNLSSLSQKMVELETLPGHLGTEMLEQELDRSWRGDTNYGRAISILDHLYPPKNESPDVIAEAIQEDEGNSRRPSFAELSGIEEQLNEEESEKLAVLRKLSPKDLGSLRSMLEGLQKIALAKADNYDKICGENSYAPCLGVPSVIRGDFLQRGPQIRCLRDLATTERFASCARMGAMYCVEKMGGQGWRGRQGLEELSTQLRRVAKYARNGGVFGHELPYSGVIYNMLAFTEESPTKILKCYKLAVAHFYDGYKKFGIDHGQTYAYTIQEN